MSEKGDRFAKAMVKALAHTGRGPRTALLMGRASYLSRRMHDFGRWHAFIEAVKCGCGYIWPRP